MRSCFRLRPSSHRSFSLIELLVTLAVVIVIMVAMLQFVTDVETTWKANAADSFAEAEDAFDSVGRHLASATLEPYQDYADTNGTFRTASSTSFVPDHLARRSDLAFVCGPSAGLLTNSGETSSGCCAFFVEPQGYTQTYAHTGLEHLLNATGYFVEFSDDSSIPAFILPGSHRWRWRLHQVRQPSESLQVFALTSSSAWIQQLVPAGTSTPILAENVIALVVLPERAASDSSPALAPDFRYDSRDATNALTRHQLPPRLRLALVAIDEASAQILASQNGTNPPSLVPSGLFQQAAQLDSDLATLDQTLLAQKIQHRIFQREILVNSAAWSDTPSQ